MLAARQWHRPVVLGLARGGVPIAAEIADVLDASLDVLVVRKIGAPGRPELGLGAITATGQPSYDASTLAALDVTRRQLEPTRVAEQAEARRREAVYRRDHAEVDIQDRDVILVDDGLATGVTAMAAVRSLRDRRPRRVVLAVPVGSRPAVRSLAREVDEVVCAMSPERFLSVGTWYVAFSQLSDQEVIAALAAARGG